MGIRKNGKRIRNKRGSRKKDMEGLHCGEGKRSTRINSNDEFGIGISKENSMNPKFDSLLIKMREMHNRKNKDYATNNDPYSNFKFAAAYADVPLYKVYLVIEGIKTARQHELLGKGKKAQNESVNDTLLDKAVYATIAASNLMDELK